MYPTFGTHHQVEIADPNIEIYDDHLVAEVSESGSEPSRRSGLTDAAFA
jgi:H2-forming N5,N10-methylenetetrahydromethanopterin dehydrogenase-like enzyme